MNIKTLLAGAAFAALSLTAAASNATVVYSNFTATPEFDTQAPAVVDTFSAGAGAGTATIVLDGYASLDGQNPYEDDFTLKVNGVTTLVGTFNLGGGGDNVVYSAPAGTVATNLSGYNGGQVSFTGGQEQLVIPVALVEGLNKFSLTYSSLPAPAHAGFQGLGDEGWGVHSVQVTGLAVPEPATWAMMLMGFGGLGAVLRSARRKQFASA